MYSFAYIFIIPAFFFLYNKLNLLSQEVKNSKENYSNLISGTNSNIDEAVGIPKSCSTECKNEIEGIVSGAIATISSQPKKTSGAVITPITTGNKTTYISLGYTATTISMDWESVTDSAVYIDMENDFGKNAKAYLEASLKVAYGNGQAFIRLYDDTNKIAVNGSELSTTNNVDYQYVTSGALALWRGRNLYKIQLKSLNTFVVTMTGAKLRISY